MFCLSILFILLIIRFFFLYLDANIVSVSSPWLKYLQQNASACIVYDCSYCFFVALFEISCKLVLLFRFLSDSECTDVISLFYQVCRLVMCKADLRSGGPQGPTNWCGAFFLVFTEWRAPFRWEPLKAMTFC